MASGNDMKAANSTYEGFINLMKYGTIVTILIVAFVVIVIQ